MTLGNYVEIVATVDDLPAAQALFTQLGFQPHGSGTVTDGCVIVRLCHGAPPTLALAYANSDLNLAASIGAVREPNHAAVSFTADGVRVTLNARPSPDPMLAGSPVTRAPLARCGKFGEFSIPVAKLETSLAAWETRGFTALYQATEPYPWAILSDELVIVGLHQTTQYTQPHLTYFAANMADRIAQLQASGLVITPAMPGSGDRIEHGLLVGPGALRFFLFTGDL